MFFVPAWLLTPQQTYQVEEQGVETRKVTLLHILARGGGGELLSQSPS
jgi:hypothetical protein